MKKFIKNNIFGLVIGILLGSGIVYGVNTYESKSIEYSPTDASWEVSNVSEALNELYDKTTNSKYIIKTTGKISRSSKSDSPISGSSFFKTGLSGYTVNKNIFLKEAGMSQKYTIELNDIVAQFYNIDSSGVANVLTGNSGQYWDYAYFIYITDQDGNPAQF